MQSAENRTIELHLSEIIRDRVQEEPGMRIMAKTARANLRDGKLWRVRRFIKTHLKHWRRVNKKKRAVMPVEIIRRMHTDTALLRVLPKRKLVPNNKNRIAKAK